MTYHGRRDIIRTACDDECPDCGLDYDCRGLCECTDAEPSRPTPEEADRLLVTMGVEVPPPEPKPRAAVVADLERAVERSQGLGYT